MYLKVPDDWAEGRNVPGSVAELLYNSPDVEVVTDFSDLDEATASVEQINRAAILAYIMRSGFTLRSGRADELLMLAAWVEGYIIPELPPLYEQKKEERNV